MEKLRLQLVFFALLAVSVGVPVATAGGGNSENAKLCQKDGWKNFVRADQTPFKNVGDCVSYAAQGGVLTKRPSQLLCESYGGTYSTDPSTNTFGGFASVLWTCNGFTVTSDSDFFAKFGALYDRCRADGGNSGAGNALRPYPSTATRFTCGTF